MSFIKTLSFWVVGSAGIGIGLLPASSFGAGVDLDSTGARFGLNPFGAGSFYQAEAFVTWDLPWSWDLGRLWRLDSRFEASLGWIGEGSADAVIGTLGPSLILARRDWPISLDCGVSPTVMSRSDFISKDFGIPFQFTSHGGLNWQVSSKIRLSYRFQHMSNADLSRHNPGLNLNMFGLSYLF